MERKETCPPPAAHPVPPRTAPVWQLLSSWILAAGVVLMAIHYGPQVTQKLRTVDPSWLLLGLISYAGNYVLRGLRFKSILPARIALWTSGLRASCIHGFATYMLPFRSGELALPFILRSASGVRLNEGSQVLIRVRLLDLHTLGLWIITFALVYDVGIDKATRSVWLAAGVLMACMPRIANWLSEVFRNARNPVLHRIAAFTLSTPFSWSERLLSIGIWGAVAVCFYCVAQAIGLRLLFTEILLLISIQLPLQLLPVQGMANAGNHEGGWVAGLTLIGISAPAALEFALVSHAILLVYVLFLGLAAVILGRIGPK